MVFMVWHSLPIWTGLLRWRSGEEFSHQCWRCKRCGFSPWIGKIPWRKKWQPTPIFLFGKFHGQRSLVGYSSWDPKESDTTEQLHFILSGVISPLFSSSILGTYQPGEFLFQCPIFLPFHTVHRVLKARILKWFAISFSSGPHFVRTLHHDPSVLGGPPRHGS